MPSVTPGWGQHGQPPPKKGSGVFSGVLLALIVFFVVLPIGGIVTCVVCVKIRADKPGASASEAPRAPPPTETEPPDGLSGTVSVAKFTKDTRLDECVDFTITLPPARGKEALAKMLDALSQTMIKGEKGLSKIAKPCSEQFRTVPVLATCTGHQEMKGDAGGGSVDMEGRYYDLDTLTSSDTYMKNCLDLQGDWEATDKDSDEYREAVRVRARREINTARQQLEKLQGAVGQ